MFGERLLWMWLGSVKHPMPLGPEAFSLCILTCEMPQLGKYMNFKNFWLDPCMLWELGKGDRIIWSLMPWFGNLAINHPDDFFNFLCPFFFFLEVDTLDFASKSNLFFHSTIILQIMSMVIYWYYLEQSLYTHLQ